jgi:hypothetical protein
MEQPISLISTLIACCLVAELYEKEGVVQERSRKAVQNVRKEFSITSFSNTIYATSIYQSLSCSLKVHHDMQNLTTDKCSCCKSPPDCSTIGEHSRVCSCYQDSLFTAHRKDQAPSLAFERSCMAPGVVGDPWHGTTSTKWKGCAADTGRDILVIRHRGLCCGR